MNPWGYRKQDVKRICYALLLSVGLASVYVFQKPKLAAYSTRVLKPTKLMSSREDDTPIGQRCSTRFLPDGRIA